MKKIAGYLVVDPHYFTYFFIIEFLVKFEINDFFLPVGELLHGSNHSCRFFFTFLLADEQRFMTKFKSCFLMNGCKCKTGFFLECPEQFILKSLEQVGFYRLYFCLTFILPQFYKQFLDAIFQQVLFRRKFASKLNKRLIIPAE